MRPDEQELALVLIMRKNLIIMRKNLFRFLRALSVHFCHRKTLKYMVVSDSHQRKGKGARKTWPEQRNFQSNSLGGRIRWSSSGAHKQHQHISLLKFLFTVALREKAQTLNYQQILNTAWPALKDFVFNVYKESHRSNDNYTRENMLARGPLHYMQHEEGADGERVPTSLSLPQPINPFMSKDISSLYNLSVISQAFLHPKGSNNNVTVLP
ncbi:hypothetical protein GOP47_0008534 [Adiantum capillus-veneris]|uniref:Uncharacterized protein n=1 Tax=Adiantum capillus-veneris TaxID=13818 RepID=A0A9D4UYW8_ADICA|nr:hypothetical protein GOP47_0008534 [Adiantum capillus-veneris]